MTHRQIPFWITSHSIIPKEINKCSKIENKSRWFTGTVYKISMYPSTWQHITPSLWFEPFIQLNKWPFYKRYFALFFIVAIDTSLSTNFSSCVHPPVAHCLVIAKFFSHYVAVKHSPTQELFWYHQCGMQLFLIPRWCLFLYGSCLRPWQALPLFFVPNHMFFIYKPVMWSQYLAYAL